MLYKANELKQIISNRLEKNLLLDEFVYNKTKNEFKSEKGDYKYVFNIDQVSWNSGYSLHVRLFISQKKIEAILESIIGKLKHKFTLAQDIERIFKSPDGRKVVNGDLSIWVRKNEDVGASVETLELYYNDIAKPYFDKYTTLNDIDDIINNPPFDHCPADVGGSFDNRCMKGLIVARLVDNPKYEQVIDIYDKAIKETMNEESIENYYKVREFLMYNRIK